MEDDHPRVRKKRREEKIHYPEQGWYNTIILSKFRGERKENSRRKQKEIGGL